MANQITVGAPIGPYTIIEEKPQGTGGMARVYIAQLMLASGEAYKVALKVVRTTDTRGNELHQADRDFYVEALNNEVEALRQLRHPNIVRLYPIPAITQRRQTPYIARAFDLPGQPWYCVMEYLDGGSLEMRIRQLRQLPLGEAAEITYQIALALDHVHSKRFAHLDVKPDNILFRRPLVANAHLDPVLIDFGIAAKLKKTGLQAGAVPYMAPERLRLMRQELTTDQLHDRSAADVYSLGICLYRMVTGHLPFESANRDRLITAILEQAPTQPMRHNRDLPGELEDLILKMLAKEPRERPSLEEVVTWVDKAVPPPRLAVRSGAGGGKTAEPVGAQAPSNGRRGGRLRWGLTFGGAVALIGLGAAFGWGVSRQFTDNSTPAPTPQATAPVALTQEVIASATRAPTRTPRPEDTEEPTATPGPTEILYTPTPLPPTPAPPLTNTRLPATRTPTPAGTPTP